MSELDIRDEEDVLHEIEAGIAFSISDGVVPDLLSDDFQFERMSKQSTKLTFQGEDFIVTVQRRR